MVSKEGLNLVYYSAEFCMFLKDPDSLNFKTQFSAAKRIRLLKNFNKQPPRVDR